MTTEPVYPKNFSLSARANAALNALATTCDMTQRAVIEAALEMAAEKNGLEYCRRCSKWHEPQDEALCREALRRMGIEEIEEE